MYKIQKRTLRCDAHYGNALLRYAREFSVTLGDSKCIFISADDKARVEVGPPGVYHQTGLRKRLAPALASEEVNACDHDFDDSSITPSVYLVHELDEGKKGSWRCVCWIEGCCLSAEHFPQACRRACSLNVFGYGT